MIFSVKFVKLDEEITMLAMIYLYRSTIFSQEIIITQFDIFSEIIN